MQRKNYFLRGSIVKQRTGFAMIMAIAVVVIISTIMAVSLKMTSESTKRTTDVYLYEQAMLYSKSAAELALLDIAKYGCKDNRDYILGNVGEVQYDANITMQYVYTNAVNDAATALPCSEYISYIKTDEQNGSVLMDISVTLHDPSIVSEPIRYFRRIIQKL